MRLPFLHLLTIAMTSMLFISAACSSSGGDATNSPVVTSFYPLEYLAERIGGDNISVKNLVPAGAEPHDWEPTPRDIAAIQKAKVFIYNGVVESWAERVVGDLPSSSPLVVRGVSGQTLNNGAEPEAPGLDPHVWLDPVRYQQEADVVYGALAKADPEHAAGYQANLDALKKDLGALDKEYKSGLAACARKTVVTSHAAFGYMAERYGLKQLAVSGISPDAEPSPARLRRVLGQIKAEGATHVFFETLVSPRIGQTLASEAGIKILVLNPLEGLTSDEVKAGDNYLTVMRRNLTNLKVALGCH